MGGYLIIWEPCSQRRLHLQNSDKDHIGFQQGSCEQVVRVCATWLDLSSLVSYFGSVWYLETVWCWIDFFSRTHHPRRIMVILHSQDLRHDIKQLLPTIYAYHHRVRPRIGALAKYQSETWYDQQNCTMIVSCTKSTCRLAILHMLFCFHKESWCPCLWSSYTPDMDSLRSEIVYTTSHTHKRNRFSQTATPITVKIE